MNTTNISILVVIIAVVIAIVAAVVLLGSNPPPETPGTTSSPSPGGILYAQNCESCHGPLATSSKRNHTAAEIQGAISTIPQMGSLSNLTADQLQQIAAALAAP
jgi:mono/diheme cytochrome c family protein